MRKTEWKKLLSEESDTINYQQIPVFRKIVSDLIVPELISRYGLQVRVFYDGDFITAASAVQSPNLIILCMKNIPDMVYGIRCVCHEYCHLLREQQVTQNARIRDIQDFYLRECREYSDHDPSAQGHQVYQYSLLELDARAFEETFGTVCTDHYFELLSGSDLRKAYADGGVKRLVDLIRQVYQV